MLVGRSGWRGWLCCAAIALIVAGCAGHVEKEVRVKELTEEVTKDELKTFLEIIDRLPDQCLPAFDSPMSPPVRWAVGQEKSIERIADEKLHQLEQRWSPNYLTQFFAKNPRLRWALSRAEMSPEVFSGIALTMGVALSRSSLPEDTDLEILLKRSRTGIRKLSEDRRSLATLPPDEQYQITQQSLWIPLLDLMTHYPLVSDATLDLVKEQRERLQKAFPPEFSANQLLHYDKILNNSGLPFEDVPETGISDLTPWNPEAASQSNLREAVESDHYESSDEAFTPPENLFSSQGEGMSAGSDSATGKRAEKPGEPGNASNGKQRESAEKPGEGLRQ